MSVSALLFIAGFALLVIAIVIYLRREDNDHAKASDYFRQTQMQMEAVEKKYDSTKTRIDDFMAEYEKCTNDVLELQNKYQALLEKQQKVEISLKPQRHDINVNFKQPIKVDMDKPMMMEFHKPIPVAITNLKKKKTPLLERAGITDDKKTNKKGK